MCQVLQTYIEQKLRLQIKEQHTYFSSIVSTNIIYKLNFVFMTYEF